MIVGAGVALYTHFIDGGLLSFADTHFQINGIINHPHFNRIHLKEKITIIQIQGTDVYFVGIIIQVGFQLTLIIHISAFNFQHFIELLRSILGISYPFDVTKIISATFANMDIYINRFRPAAINSILNDCGISVAFVVIFGNQFAQVGVIIIPDKFTSFKDPYPEVICSHTG